LRLLFGLVIGVVGALLSSGHTWEFRLLLGWDAGAFALLAFIWFIVLTKDPHETRCRSASADPGRTATWVLVLIASGFSFIASAFVLKNLHKTQPPPEPWLLPLCLVSVIVAWSLTHTSYTLRYAHLYYRDDEEGEGGLVFPGERKPDDFDFAYFAHTVGMCFQVSDISISSAQIRRAVLGHAMLSLKDAAMRGRSPIQRGGCAWRPPFKASARRRAASAPRHTGCTHSKPWNNPRPQQNVE
jgi:uncharacterized membrane protein